MSASTSGRVVLGSPTCNEMSLLNGGGIQETFGTSLYRVAIARH